MPTFLSVIDALSGNTMMSEVNYVSVRDNHREFILPNMWEVSWITRPAAVYYPGDEIFRARLNAIAPSIPTGITGIQQVIRGYTKNQKTSVSTNGTVTLTFIDKEDQSMTMFCDDWKNKISDPDTKYSFRTEDTMADIKHLILNTGRIPIRKLEYLGCQPSEVPLNEEGTGEAEISSHLGEIPLNLDFEHFTRVPLNL